LDWPANTVQYWHRDGKPTRPRGSTGRTPWSITTSSSTPGPRRASAEHRLPPRCCRDGTPDGTGLWQQVSQSAYLEADFPYAAAFTGRQFSNDEVYRAGYGQEFINHGTSNIQGIYH
jgi:hypothetical protein